MRLVCFLMMFVMTSIVSAQIDTIRIGKCASDLGSIYLNLDTLYHVNGNGNIQYVTLPQGPAGVQGPQGIQGPQGPQGIPGTTPPPPNLFTSNINGEVRINAYGQNQPGVLVTGAGGLVVSSTNNSSFTITAPAPADASATNELQTISTNGAAGNITLSNSGGTLNLNVNDADASATNELQTLSIAGDQLSISSGNTVTIPIGSGGATQYLNPYLINSDTVGFYLTVAQDTVVFRGVNNVSGESTTVGDTPTIDMTLTGTNITAAVVDGSITPAKLSQTYLTSEVDGSVSNELQTLSINNNQLSITGGNTVTLPSGGSTEWASLDYGTQAANTQSFTSSVWNTINFLGSNESNSAIINANHTNDDIEFVVAGNYKIDYAVSFVANADALIYMGLHSSVTNDVPFKTQIEGDTDVGYKTCQMSKSIIYSATAGEKLKLQIQPLTAHTSVGVYAHFIITKL